MNEDLHKNAIVRNQTREGRSHPLPPVQYLLQQGNTSITIRQPCLSVNAWQKRTEPIRPYVKLSRIKKPVRFMVQAPLEYNPVAFTGRIRTKGKEKDFTRVRTEVPPMKPEGKHIITVESGDNVNMESEPPDVSTVD